MTRVTPGNRRRRIALAVSGLLLSIAPASADPPGAAGGGVATLDDAIAAALRRNERAHAAAARRSAAEARVDQARAFFFPTVTAQGAYRYSRGAPRRTGDRDVAQTGSSLTGDITASVPLFDARAYPLYRQARLERDAARIDEREEVRRLAFDVAGAFLQTLTRDRLVLAARRRVELAIERRDDARRRADARLVGGNDVTRAELEVATAERERIAAETDLAAAYQQLSFLIDAEVQTPLIPPRALLAGAAAPPSGDPALTAAARTSRRDLAAARLRVEAARERALEPGRRIWPTLDATGQLRAFSAADLSEYDHDWFIGLTATWTLWDGGQRAAEEREREHAAEVAALETAGRERQLAGDVATAAAILRGAQASVHHAEAQVAVARRNSDEIGVLYAQGLARAIEVADAGARLYDAEVSLASAELAVGAAYLDLRAVTGLLPLGEVSP